MRWAVALKTTLVCAMTLAAITTSAAVNTSAVKRGLADPLQYQCADWSTAVNYTKNISGSAGGAAAPPFGFAYTWGSTTGTDCDFWSPAALPKDPATGVIGFVPMLWSAHDVARINDTALRRGYEPYALLGFNEPNHASQSNMSPAAAAAAWPHVEAVAAALNVTVLVSPAAAPCGSSNPHICPYGDVIPWFQQFRGNCSGCRIDAVATHFYGCHLDELTTLLTALHGVFDNAPVWLTEFNCGGGTSDVPVPHQLAWMGQAVAWLEATPWVHHYSWMAGRDGHDLPAALFVQAADGSVSPTALGKYYLSH